MALTSYITAKPIMGYDPVGYVPFVTPAEEYLITVHNLLREYDETTFFVFDPLIANNQDEFLTALKTDLDTNYAATNFTDATRDYLIDYKVVKAERTYNAPSSSIWEDREYVWKVTVQVKVNTNA